MLHCLESVIHLSGIRRSPWQRQVHVVGSQGSQCHEHHRRHPPLQQPLPPWPPPPQGAASVMFHRHRTAATAILPVVCKATSPWSLEEEHTALGPASLRQSPGVSVPGPLAMRQPRPGAGLVWQWLIFHLRRVGGGWIVLSRAALWSSEVPSSSHHVVANSVASLYPCVVKSHNFSLISSHAGMLKATSELGLNPFF